MTQVVCGMQVEAQLEADKVAHTVGYGWSKLR